MSQDAAALAKALINTKSKPSGLAEMQAYARKAAAYHAMTPYPQFGFQNWKTENRGVLPQCMPIAKRIVERGARWLFGSPLQLICTGNTNLENLIRDAWQANRMDSRLPAMGKRGGLEGGVVLKYAYDGKAVLTPKLTFQSLSSLDECRVFTHPHNRDLVLMARVQYRYQDLTDGKWKWYREEWTAEEEVHYEPIVDASSNLASSTFDADTCPNWKESTREANKLGVIPFHYVRNLETDDLWGAADLWSLGDGDGLFKIIDRLNLTRWLQDVSNQFDAALNPFLIDADLKDDEVDKPVAPGEPVSIQSVDGGPNQAKVVFPTGSNNLRPAMQETCKDLIREIQAAASAVDVDQSEITNKGNLTRAVLEQIYLPQIEITHEKRKSYGQDGLCKFFELVAIGLANIGVLKGVDPNDRDTFTVAIKWPDFFPLSEEEKQAIVGRTQEEELAGYLPHDRAIERIAAIEGITDVATLKEELADAPEPDKESQNAGGTGPAEPPDDVNKEPGATNA